MRASLTAQWLFSPALIGAHSSREDKIASCADPLSARFPMAVSEAASRSQQNQRRQFMIIGKFSHEVTKFVGQIKTLGFETDAVIQQATKHSEKAPDFRIVDKAGFDIGVAYDEISERQNRYLSVQLDSPTFPKPVYCALVQTTNGWELKWQRQKPKPETKVENGKFRDAA
jgi:uncharacterized protein (DUF736 family)